MFETDIPRKLAIEAHAGTSFSPEKRADSEIADYEATLTADLAQFRSVAEKNGTGALVDAEFERYRQGYKKRVIAYLSSRTRFVSAMICGPSKYPARRMEKRHGVIENRLNELVGYRERAKAAIIKTLCPGLRPIMAGDADAIERLVVKLEEAKRMQVRMKEANAAIRKHKKAGQDAQVAALVDLGFSPTLAGKLLLPDFCGRIGFADYQLTNNNANIRRMEQRLATLRIAHATPDTEAENEETGVRMEDCPAENRVRLYYPGKPDDKTRDNLKRSGWRWAPSIGCWQAYRNYGTLEFAKNAVS